MEDLGFQNVDFLSHSKLKHEPARVTTNPRLFAGISVPGRAKRTLARIGETRTCQEDWPRPILLTSGRWLAAPPVRRGGHFNLSERLAQPNLVDEWAVGYVDDGFDAHHTTTIITTTKTTTNTQTAITITTLIVHLE